MRIHFNPRRLTFLSARVVLKGVDGLEIQVVEPNPSPWLEEEQFEDLSGQFGPVAGRPRQVLYCPAVSCRSRFEHRNWYHNTHLSYLITFHRP